MSAELWGTTERGGTFQGFNCWLTSIGSVPLREKSLRTLEGVGRRGSSSDGDSMVPITRDTAVQKRRECPTPPIRRPAISGSEV